jgi:predicted ATP-dependent endonuclease of OLD family
MMRYLKRISSQGQVFITTHSTNFLDTGEMKNVYLISKTDSTQIQQLNLEEAETEIPKELGIRLSSLFMYDRLVFVEGPSDEAIIREWASLMKINFGQANVGFVSMGGVRNFTHYATESTLSFLTKRQVKMWFLIDKDERNDADVKSLEERLKEKAVVKVLEKREVENYLINNRAIIEFIKFKKQSSDTSTELEIKESDIAKLIEDCAEQLKQTSIDKRVAKILCKPVYLSQDKIFSSDNSASAASKISDEIDRVTKQLEDNKNKIAEVYEEQSIELEKNWDAEKLSLVQGDLLLDEVCKKYGVRFKKERDSARLASFMKEQEIDSEVKKIIQEISKIPS